MPRDSVSPDKSSSGGIASDRRKNIDGKLGPRCNNCSGLGALGSMGGSLARCKRCDGSGVEPPDVVELQKRVNVLVETVDALAKRIAKLEKRK